MSNTVTTTKKLRLGWIALSFVFFWNPNISVFDFLPDCLGYLFLCMGLSKIADLNESLEGALSLFKKMILIDLGKLLAIFWTFGLGASSERNASLLLFTFAFAVVECIVLIPAYGKLFGGMTQVGYFFQNRSIFSDDGREAKRSKTDKAGRFAKFFVVWKATFSVLPELAELTNGDYSELSVSDSLYRYIGVMRLMAFVPVFLLGIVWCIRMISYFKRVEKDTLLTNGLLEKYTTTVLPKKGLFVRRSFNLSFLLLMIGLILSADLRLENRNLFPDFLVSVSLFFVFYFLVRHVEVKRFLWIGTVALHFVCSIIGYVAELRFFGEFNYSAILRNDEARNAYALLVGCNVLKTIAFVLLMWMLIYVLRMTVLKHTGYVSGREHFGEQEQKMIENLHREEWHSLLRVFVSVVLYAVSDVCFDLLAPEYGFMGLVNLIFASICVIAFFRAMFNIQGSIQTKYMLEE